MKLTLAVTLDFAVLFIMDIKNNELSATMDKIKKLIDNKSVISQYDRHTLLQEFTRTNILGNITLNAVHFEVLLMNQMRDAEDEVAFPAWTIPNAPYQILTLSKSLSDNRSIAIRLQSSNINKTLLNPKSEKVTSPAMVDLMYMEQPQEFLNSEVVSDEYKPKSDKEKNIIQPFTFDDPKINAGRILNKKHIPKSRKDD